jgi:cytochrome c biogenesis factor
MPSFSPTSTMQIVGGCPLQQQIEKPQDLTVPLLANKLYHSSYASFTLPKIIPQLLHLAYFFSTISLFGILFCYISSNFSNYNVFTNSNFNAPLFHKISRTWSNLESHLLLWCWILRFYEFFFCYRA